MEQRTEHRLQNQAQRGLEFWLYHFPAAELFKLSGPQFSHLENGSMA